MVAREIWGISVPRGTDSEALQGWIIKIGEYSKILHTSVKKFVDWLSNKIPTWTAYHKFMSDLLISLDKQPGVCPVGAREMRRRLFANIFLKFTGIEVTIAFQDDHLCAGLKEVIGRAVHRVQDIWGSTFTTKHWVFLIVDAKTRSTISIK